MVNLASLRERYELINSLFADHTTQIAQLQDDACGVLVQQLTDELSLQQSGVDRALAFLDDPVTCFRFLRKAHFDSLLARELLRKTLRWRLTSALDLLSFSLSLLTISHLLQSRGVPRTLGKTLARS